MTYVLTFFTENGTPKTGLTPKVNIRNLSDNSLVVTAGSMSAVGDDGLYKYDFSAFDSKNEYSIYVDGGATLDDIDRYKFGSDIVVKESNTYGGIYQEQRTTVDLKQNEFRDYVKKVLGELSKTIKDVSKKDYNNQFNSVKKDILAKIKTIEKSLNETSKFTKDVVMKELKTVSDGSVKIKDDINTKLSQKIESVNNKISMFTELVKETNEQNSKTHISKMSELKDNLFSSISDVSNNINNLSTEIGDLGLMNKTYIETKEKIDKFNNEILENTENMKNEIMSFNENLKSFREDNFNIIENINDTVSKKMDKVNKEIKEHESKFGNDTSYDKNLFFIKKLNDEKILGIVNKMDEYMKSINDFNNTDVKNIETDVTEITKSITLLRNENDKFINSISEMLPKLSNKKDLSATIEVIDNSIKKMNDSNAVKIKDLKAKLSSINDITSKKFQEINSKLKSIKEDSNISFQLDVMKEDVRDK